MTLDFLNALIRDGVEAGESLNIDWTTQRRNGSETKELCFLEDIHQSLMYLNEQIITVRQYLKDLPSTGAASEPVNEFELDPSPYSLRKVPVSKDFKVGRIIITLLTNGKQKCMKGDQENRRLRKRWRTKGSLTIV